MKLVKRSRMPSLKGQPAGMGAVRQDRRIAMGKQGAVGTTKNPGSKGSRLPGMRKK